MSDEKPKLACLPNGPYHLLNDSVPTIWPNLQDAQGNACATIAGFALCRENLAEGTRLHLHDA
jgi:hypothetical protein